MGNSGDPGALIQNLLEFVLVSVFSDLVTLLPYTALLDDGKNRGQYANLLLGGNQHFIN